eukprot:PITA_06200
MEFPKASILTPYNYHEWKDQMARYIRQKGLYRITMAIEVEPTSAIEKSKYLNRMDEAHGSICMCISLELQFHLSACNTPNEIWKKVDDLYGKQDEMKGHMIEVELLSLDPRNYDRIQDFFTKYNDLLLQLKGCGIDKSKEESHQILFIISKLGPEYSVFVSTFHSVRLATGKSYTMPSLQEFMESLIFEQDKLIGMGKIKPSKAHALAVHDSSHNKHHRSDSSQKNQQKKDKGKAHSHPKKEGYTKPFNDSSGSRNEKGKKGNRCTYSQRGFHPESSCMKKQIDQMTEILQKHNLGDHIPQGAKKKTEDLPHGRGNNFHALVAINSSPDAWIIDSGASHHMVVAQEVYFSLDACKGPPILMGDDSPIEYRITHSGTGKRVEFTPDAVNIYDLHNSAKIETGEVNNGARLYTFSEFIESKSSLLLTHADDSSRLWHERFGHLNYRNKSEFFEHFEDFKALVETQPERKIKALRTDNGGEYVNTTLRNLCLQSGIQLQYIVPYTPQQNGVAERKNRSLKEMASYMLHANSLPHKLWAEALNCANYIQNRSPHRSIKNQTPFESWSGTKPEITHLRVFGSRAWARIPSENRQALDPQRIECIFVGYPDGVKGYRLLIPSTDKLIIKRSVKFEESLSHAPQSPHADTFYLPHVRDDDSVHSDVDAETESSDTNLVHANDDPHPSPDQASSSESYSPVINQRTRSLREIYAQDQPAARNGLVGDNSDLQRTSLEFIEPPIFLIATEPSPSWNCHLVQSSDPQSYAEAAGHPSWESAMEEEYNSLLENQTWDLVPLPSGRKLVRCKWVYRTKRATDGQITSLQKARLVAKGFQQVHGIDYDETFAPVEKMDSIRLTLTIAATQRWEVHKMDVKNVFLNGDLSEEIYMEQPHGFIQDSSFVCKLKISLYSLKQALRAWYAKMDSFLLSQNFERCKSDPNVYMLRTHDSLLILVLYVDDLLITSSSASAIATVKRALHDRFLMTDMGPLHFFFGLEISQDATGIKLSQAKYARDLLEIFRMADCKPAPTPFLFGVRLEDGGDTPLVGNTLYRQLVGSLLYLTHSRPDLSYAIGAVSRYMQKLHELHWNAAKRILRYVQGTITFGIHYVAGSALNLLGFTDSDWGPSPPPAIHSV